MNEQAVNAMQEYITQNIDELVKMADRYNVERDELVTSYANIFQTFAEIATLRNYKVRGGN